MPFFGSFRSALKMSTAKQLIQKELERELALAHLTASAAELSHFLVIGIWNDHPTLKNIREIPRAATVAAGALAWGIKHFDSTEKNKSMGDVLHSALQNYMLYVFPKLVLQPELLQGIDSELVTYAYSTFN